MILPHLLLQSNFELLDRQTHLTSILLFIILACSAIVGAGRINNPNFFTAISTGFFKFKAQDKSFNENLRISQGCQYRIGNQLYCLYIPLLFLNAF